MARTALSKATADLPVPAEHMMERLNVAYALAVAARGGWTVQQSSGPEYGTDMTLLENRRLTNGKCKGTGFELKLQLKATTKCQLLGGEVVYRLSADAYNGLVSQTGLTPSFLVVMRLPDDYTLWLTQSEEELLMRNCAYWYLVEGQPTTTSGGVLLRIPRTNIFNHYALPVMAKIAREHARL